MDISESLDGILGSENILGNGFYDIFMVRHPEVQMYFEGVNLQRQGALLATALVLVECHYKRPRPAIETYLQHLGEKHRRLGIAPEHFPSFISALLETLRRYHGRDWSDELQNQWRDALEKTTEVLLRSYRNGAD